MKILTFILLLSGLLGCSQLLQPDQSDPDQSDREHIDLPTAPDGSGFTGERFSVRADDGELPADVARELPAREVRTLDFETASYVIYELRDGVAMDEVTGELNRLEGVSAEATRTFQLFDSSAVNAPAYEQEIQYAPQIVGAESAWDSATGDGVTVAVVDTGIRGGHREFGEEAFAEGGFDYIADEEIEPGENRDNNGHGTHVAGIVAARAYNGVGMAGLSWGATLMDFAVFNDEGGANSADIAAAIERAVNEGADIINLSLGSARSDQITRSAVQYALDSDVVVVAATGNTGYATTNFPAYYPGVIAVGSTDARDELSYYSTTGAHTTVVAPGENIFSSVHGSDSAYAMFDGTSMSSPLVAGAAALLLEANDELTHGQVKRILKETAVDIGLEANRMGAGRIDAGAAVSEAHDPPEDYGNIHVIVENTDGATEADVEVLLLDENGETVFRRAVSSDGSSSSDGNDAVEEGVAYFTALPDQMYTVAIQGDSESVNVDTGETIEATLTVDTSE